MARMFVRLKAAGNAERVGGPGVGFRLVPAADVADANATRVGSFPVTVRLRTPNGGYDGDPIPVVNSDALFLRDDDEKFSSLDVIGGESGDSWLVEVFEKKSHGVIPASAKTRRQSQVQAATALPTAVPTGTDGFRVRPGTVGHQFYFTGTLQNARLWVRSKGGTWVDTLEDLDATVDPTPFRAAYAAADRIYLRVTAATMNAEVDAVEEVG